MPLLSTILRQTKTKRYFVSTIVHTGGMDAMHDPYETMVFVLKENGEPNVTCSVDYDRYEYPTQAELGHEAMVRKWRNREVTDRARARRVA